MGIFSKKHKDRKYISEDAQDDPDPEYSKRKDPYLIIGDAPPKPGGIFAGKGLEPNTRYQLSREDEEDADDSRAGDCSND